MITLGIDYGDFDGDIACAVLCERRRDGIFRVLRTFYGRDSATLAERLALALNVQVADGGLRPAKRDE